MSEIGDASLKKYVVCPVCFELPKKEVYQCRNGHILCKSCYPQLQQCPQCREPFGKNNVIRNRVLEELLDALKVNCPFRVPGCPERIFKESLQQHETFCHFNFAKFGSLINICKFFGYPNCPFSMNHGSTDMAIEHFKKVHKVPIHSNVDFALMELMGFTGTIFQTIGDVPPARSLPTLELASSGKKSNDNYTWRPMILKVNKGGKNYALLIHAIYRRNVDTLFWVVAYMPGVDEKGVPFPLPKCLEIEFELIAKDEGGPPPDMSEESRIRWKMSPIDVLKAGSCFPESFPFQLQIGGLSSAFVRNDNGSLKVLCKTSHSDGPSDLADLHRRLQTVPRNQIQLITNDPPPSPPPQTSRFLNPNGAAGVSSSTHNLGVHGSEDIHPRLDVLARFGDSLQQFVRHFRETGFGRMPSPRGTRFRPMMGSVPFIIPTSTTFQRENSAGSIPPASSSGVDLRVIRSSNPTSTSSPIPGPSQHKPFIEAPRRVMPSPFKRQAPGATTSNSPKRGAMVPPPAHLQANSINNGIPQQSPAEALHGEAQHVISELKIRFGENDQVEVTSFPPRIIPTGPPWSPGMGIPIFSTAMLNGSFQRYGIGGFGVSPQASTSRSSTVVNNGNQGQGATTSQTDSQSAVSSTSDSLPPTQDTQEPQ